MRKQNSKKLRQQIKHSACSRCGQIQKVEIHHQQSVSSGGNDETSNLIALCKGCHDYQHAKENILNAINSEYKRLAVLKERLRILERENSPEAIQKRGYQTYWDYYQKALPLRSLCARRF